MTTLINDWKNWEIGSKDNEGYVITNIREKNNKYIIYEIFGYAIKIEGNFKTKAFDNIDKKRKEVMSLIKNKRISKIVKNDIVNFISAAAQDNYDSAISLLENLENKLQSYIIIKAKSTYLLPGLSLILLSTIFLATFTFNSYLASLIAEDKSIYFFNILLIWSIAGGILSIIIKINTYKVEFNDPNFIHFFNGLTRILIAVISSSVAYILFSTGIIDYIIEANSPKYYAISFISGFLENFVPKTIKIIRKIFQ